MPTQAANSLRQKAAAAPMRYCKLTSPVPSAAEKESIPAGVVAMGWGRETKLAEEGTWVAPLSLITETPPSPAI